MRPWRPVTWFRAGNSERIHRRTECRAFSECLNQLEESLRYTHEWLFASSPSSHRPTRAPKAPVRRSAGCNARVYFFDDHTYPVTTAYVILPSRSPILTLPTVPVPITHAARQIKGLKRFYKVAEVVPSSDTDGVRALIRAVVSLAGLHPWAVLVAGEWRVMCDSHYASLSPCCNTLVSPRFYELSTHPSVTM